jgi:hypothetical protein
VGALLPAASPCPRGRLAQGRWTSPNRLGYWDLEDIYEGGGRTAAQLRQSAALRYTDAALPQVYDGFSLMTCFWLVVLGYFPVGEAHGFLADGEIRREGGLLAFACWGALGNGRMHRVPQTLECTSNSRAGQKVASSTVCGGRPYSHRTLEPARTTERRSRHAHTERIMHRCGSPDRTRLSPFAQRSAQVAPAAEDPPRAARPPGRRDGHHGAPGLGKTYRPATFASPAAVCGRSTAPVDQLSRPARTQPGRDSGSRTSGIRRAVFA